MVMQWFRDNKKKIKLIPWPADFGDLMPLELFWEEIAEMINNKGNVVRPNCLQNNSTSVD